MFHNKLPCLFIDRIESSSSPSSTVTFSDFTSSQTNMDIIHFGISLPKKKVSLCEVDGYTSQIPFVQISAVFSYIHLHCNAGSTLILVSFCHQFISQNF